MSTLPAAPSPSPELNPARAATGFAMRASALASLMVLSACASLQQAPGAAAPAGRPGAPAAAVTTPMGTSAPAAAPTTMAGAAPATAASGPSAPGATAATSPPAPGQPPPFAVVIKDAQEVKGLFTAWRKDEKLWLELRPEDIDQPFFLSPKLRTGIGEAMLYGGLMQRGPRLVKFHRQHNVVQLLAINGQQVALAGTPEARAVAVANSPSLLGANLVASQAHPQRKSVLVEANAIFLGDMLGLGAQLQRSFRQGYGLDGRNSALTEVRGQPDLLVLEANLHFATSSIAVPQPAATPSTPPAGPQPSVPEGLPDPRSLFLGVHYSLARLPAQPMAARQADPRLGHFVSVRDDFSDDLARNPRQRFVNRWRLDKQDPAAALSAPVKPITFWLDRNIPLKYRAAITDGVLEWNKAFERIGFQDAIVVKQQPDDASFDTLDANVASLRWMVNREPGFGAIGPSHVDPRSGEILDADIGIESLSSRNLRNLRSRILGSAGTTQAAQEWASLLQVGQVDAPAFAGAVGADMFGRDLGQCQHADQAAEQLGYAFDVLAARGETEPDSAEAQQFVLDYLKGVSMHEVGHTLGLRHNFKASRAYTLAQLDDPAFTEANGIAASVMDYPELNLPTPGVALARHGAPFRAALGPYDYWVIEYAYRPSAAADEAAMLARIAARSGEPGLAYGSDEDNALGTDPEALQNDLGDDVLAFASRRFDIARDLFRRQETRQLRPDEDYGSLRRSLGYAVRDAGRAAGVLLRQVGGVRTLRDFPNTGRDPLQPLPAADQRAALQMLSQQVLAADSFVISPALQRKLAPDFFERDESRSLPTEFALGQTVLDMQRGILNRLMGDALASRVLDNETKLSPPAQPLRLGELYAQLETDIWSELAAGQAITQPRRELQREHVSRLTALVLRPSLMSRSDARALVRGRAAALALRIERAGQRMPQDTSSSAHLSDSAESLRAALAAPLQRAGG